MFGFFKTLFAEFNGTKTTEINPATGLPLIENSQIDVAGNVSGFSNDSHYFHSNDYHSNSFSTFD